MSVKFLSILVIFSAMQVHASVTWPTDTEWNALNDGSGEYSDVSGDGGSPGNSDPALDIVGDDTHSAGYLLYAEQGSITNLFLRMRLDAAPNGKKDVTWFFLFDTDSSAGVNYIVTLQGTMQSTTFSSGYLTIQEVTTGGTDSDALRSTVVWSTVATTDNMRFGIADTSINTSQDYFVDMVVPWDEFSLQTGVLSTNEGASVALATDDAYTGTDAINLGIGGDVGFVGSGETDLTQSLSEAIPEPAIASLILIFGGILIATHRFMRA